MLSARIQETLAATSEMTVGSWCTLASRPASRLGTKQFAHTVDRGSALYPRSARLGNPEDRH
jgi:hypothetical protein